jgi:ABC-type transporter Mla subunit MlaD
MADNTNLYQDLLKALQDFQSFLDKNTATIKPAIKALETVVPQLSDLIGKLVSLLQTLKTTVQGINAGAGQVGAAIQQVSAFTSSVQTLVNAAANLLPQNQADVSAVLQAASVVTSLPSLGNVIDAILKAIDGVVADLQSLQ